MSIILTPLNLIVISTIPAILLLMMVMSTVDYLPSYQIQTHDTSQASTISDYVIASNTYTNLQANISILENQLLKLTLTNDSLMNNLTLLN